MQLTREAAGRKRRPGGPWVEHPWFTALNAFFIIRDKKCFEWNMYIAKKHACYIIQNINVKSIDFLNTIIVTASPFTACHRGHCSCCSISFTMSISWWTFGKLSSGEWCIIHPINHFCQEDGIHFLFPWQNHTKFIFLWEDKMESLCFKERHFWNGIPHIVSFFTYMIK